jgi:hypothetical protein
VERAEADPRIDAAEQLSSVVQAGVDIWTEQAKRWRERTDARTTWSPEDVVGDCTNLIENLTPLVERSIDLTIEFFRPWAQAFEARK